MGRRYETAGKHLSYAVRRYFIARNWLPRHNARVCLLALATTNSRGERKCLPSVLCL